jgi:FKBP-type peptidyl-prolyl cis-trans isomerase FklB
MFLSRSFFSFVGVVAVASLSPYAAASDAEGLAYLASNRAQPGVIELPSGLQYKPLVNGTGAYHPGASTPCSCHYAGTLLDGSTFDSSYDRDEPTTFAPNQVIAGWTEAMQRMVQGDQWELYIPSELAYGERGSPPRIPPNAVLIFRIEILEILGADVVPAFRCDVVSREGCRDQEIAYLDKIHAWEVERKTTELQRLQRMVDAKVKPELKLWMERRIHLLQQMVGPPATSDDAEKEL